MGAPELEVGIFVGCSHPTFDGVIGFGITRVHYTPFVYRVLKGGGLGNLREALGALRE